MCMSWHLPHSAGPLAGGILVYVCTCAGANDTANAAGPYAAVQHMYIMGLDACGAVRTPIWVLAFCGLGIVMVRHIALQQGEWSRSLESGPARHTSPEAHPPHGPRCNWRGLQRSQGCPAA